MDTPTILKILLFYTYLPMKMEQTECSETSAYKIQTPGNYPEENIQHTEHSESLKSRILQILYQRIIRTTAALMEMSHWKN
jgi:hypothetical protein